MKESLEPPFLKMHAYCLAYASQHLTNLSGVYLSRSPNPSLTFERLTNSRTHSPEMLYGRSRIIGYR